MRIFLTAVAVAGIGAGVPLVCAASQPGLNGERLYSFHACVNCHGARGLVPAREVVPKIGGLPAEEIVRGAAAVIHARMDAEATAMTKWSRELQETCNARPTERDLGRIAEWLSAQE